MAFDNNYAEFYNLLYQDKDYTKESAYIDRLINKYKGDSKSIKVLDLACGTGRHAFELESLGYEVDGSDISSNMIEIARQEALKSKSKVNFYNYSFQEADKINRKYDAVISMFSAINYLTTYNDLSKTLKNIGGLLKEDGIFIFDYWNGNAVVRDYSPVKVLRKSNSEGEIIRISRTELDFFEQIASVEFTCIYSKDNVKQTEFTELHKMRYFYFKELENLLFLNGFEIAYRSAFLDTEGNTDPFDWNISIIAQKIAGRES